MMKKISILSSILLLFFAVANAQLINPMSPQLVNPVRWSYSAKKLADKTYELHITANLDDKWCLYAQEASEGRETSFSFVANPLIKLDGKVKESGKLEKKYDRNLKTVLKYYNNQVDFIQKVKLRSAVTTLVKGTVTYVVCNDKKCLPANELPFSIQVEGK